MNGDTLGDAMLAAVDALATDDKKNRSKVFRAMGAAIVAHIKANATVAVASVSGVTAGSAASGPGTGTIS